jgi:hypothetical protein
LNSDKKSNLAGKSSFRQRGKGFPTVPLPDAVAILRDAGKYGTSHALSAFAGYMGHRTTNSGPFKQRLAAFRDWGLVTTEGQTVKMTSLGSQLALPSDPALEPANLLEAFRNCKEFQGVYDRTAKGVALDLESIGNTAVHELGVSAKTKKAFAESFAKSAAAVGLAERPSEDKIVLLGEPEDRTRPEERGDAGDELGEARSPATPQPVVFRQPWSFPGGQVTLEVRLDRALPPASFGQLGAVAEAVEKFLESLNTEDAAGASA